MARILYGVMGDSRGHLSRSLAVVQSLADHEVLFLGGGTVHELKGFGYQVEDLPMAATIRRNNAVDIAATAANAARVFLGQRKMIRRIEEIIVHYDPDLIITDYEFFTPKAARRSGRPCISIDHQHVLTHCRYDPPPGQTVNRLVTCGIIRSLYSAADRFMVVSFFQLPAKDASITEVFPPVLRREVQDHQATGAEHGLVYLSDATFSGLLSVLEGRARRFTVYGTGEQPRRNNLVFKRKSDHGFLEDLASCAYVIANAGHSLISEALHFGKPVLCFPREFEYEQFLNAYFLERFGFGDYMESLENASARLDMFESRLDEYREHIRAERFFGNRLLAERLESLVRPARS